MSFANSKQPQSGFPLLHEHQEVLALGRRLLRERGLPCEPLQLASPSGGAKVVLGAHHVVRLRIPGDAGHRREAASAAQAIALGVRAPRIVVTEEAGSIWERLPGVPAASAARTDRRFWRPFLRDLARLHALPAPLDAARPCFDAWHPFIDRLSELEETERSLLHQVAQERIPPARLTYAHGDVHAGHLLITDDGGYGGLVDWKAAGWWPPELDYAMLPPDGIREAIDAPFEPIDWSLVATLRIGAMVMRYRAGSVPLRDLQMSLGFWQLMR